MIKVQILANPIYQGCFTLLVMLSQAMDKKGFEQSDFEHNNHRSRQIASAAGLSFRQRLILGKHRAMPDLPFIKHYKMNSNCSIIANS